jgi:hypothetical protein
MMGSIELESLVSPCSAQRQWEFSRRALEFVHGLFTAYSPGGSPGPNLQLDPDDKKGRRQDPTGQQRLPLWSWQVAEFSHHMAIP